MKTGKCRVGLTVFLLSALLVACGGGGGGGGEVRTGFFKDSNVSGLRYKTSSGQTGVTDQRGQYTYRQTDNVTFTIGGVTLGNTAANGVVTPVDLVVGGSTKSPAVQNIVRFLMMLDLDGDPKNGIEISSDVQTIAKGWTAIDFSADLEAQAASFITDCNSADGAPHVLPSANDARNHLADTLLCAYSGAFRGNFGGSSSGTFGVIINPQTGDIQGGAIAYGDDKVKQATGGSILDYDQSMSFFTSFVATGVSFEGSFITTNTMEGNWEDPSIKRNGEFSGWRIGGATNASRRYTGVAYDPSGSYVGAILTLDVSDDGRLRGTGYDLWNNVESTIQGTVEGSTITATSTNGALISGTVYEDNKFNGTWENHKEEESGRFEGCGCKLN